MNCPICNLPLVAGLISVQQICPQNNGINRNHKYELLNTPYVGRIDMWNYKGYRITRCEKPIQPMPYGDIYDENDIGCINPLNKYISYPDDATIKKDVDALYHFVDCPQCHSPWPPVVKQKMSCTSQCGMIVEKIVKESFGPSIKSVSFRSVSRIVGKYKVIWDKANKVCKAYKIIGGKARKNKQIILSQWLPYNIPDDNKISMEAVFG